MDSAECSSRAREYRDLAIECSLRARGAVTPQGRACYESVAQSYQHMAEELGAVDRADDNRLEFTSCGAAEDS